MRYTWINLPIGAPDIGQTPGRPPPNPPPKDAPAPYPPPTPRYTKVSLNCIID